MADAPTPPQQQPADPAAIAITGTRLIVAALNECPGLVADDFALATSLASAIRSVEKHRAGSRVRALLFKLLSDPRV
jgi:hypothetical protein